MTATITKNIEQYTLDIRDDDGGWVVGKAFLTAQEAFDTVPSGVLTQVSIQPASSAGKQDEQEKCPVCGNMVPLGDVSTGIDPYNADINNGEIEVTMCSECFHQSAMDI